MARVIAALRLLLLLTRRDLKGLASVGLNNLFFCALFLMQGSRSPRTAFFSSLLFQLLLFVPLLFAMSAEALERVPAVRARLWPLTAGQHLLLRAASLALSPAFWLLGVLTLVWGGLAAGLCFFGLALAVQLVVALLASVRRSSARLRLLRIIPRFPGVTGGLVQLELRHLLTTLDVYAALLLCVAGSCYRLLAKAPQVEAFPILAIFIALALSTCAQRSFGLDGTAGLARYRQLPLPGWRLLLAKDAAYLLVAGLLVLPLDLRAGVTFSLTALAVGRYPAIRNMVPQRAWRFTSGDVRFGMAQVLLGGGFALAASRTSVWFAALAGLAYAVSVALGGRGWERLLKAPKTR